MIALSQFVLQEYEQDPYSRSQRAPGPSRCRVAISLVASCVVPGLKVLMLTITGSLPPHGGTAQRVTPANSAMEPPGMLASTFWTFLIRLRHLFPELMVIRAQATSTMSMVVVTTLAWIWSSKIQLCRHVLTETGTEKRAFGPFFYDGWQSISPDTSIKALWGISYLPNSYTRFWND